MNWQTLLSLGDSITIGSRSYLGYPEATCAFLRRELDQYWNAVNFATAGSRAIDLARSMDLNHAHLVGTKPGIVSLLVGTNDAKTGTSVEDFASAYEQVLIKGRLIAGHNNIIAIEIPTLLPGMLYPYLPAMNGTIGKFNGVIERLAAEHDIRMFRFMLGPEHFFDGVHLNDLGVSTGALQLSRFILKDKRIEGPADLS
jgi:lysophospholipase L1-like esterase